MRAGESKVGRDEIARNASAERVIAIARETETAKAKAR